MKFLAIDTSGRALNVVAVNEEKTVVSRREDCAMRHSVLLMDAIDGALKEAGMTLADCDFLACVVGPGSFTGIRIGIATVKGLCLAGEKKALSLTTFDTLAYADTDGKRLCLVDAGHGNVYACGYDGTQVVLPRQKCGREDGRRRAGASVCGEGAGRGGVRRARARSGVSAQVLCRGKARLSRRQDGQGTGG